MNTSTITTNISQLLRVTGLVILLSWQMFSIPQFAFLENMQKLSCLFYWLAIPMLMFLAGMDSASSLKKKEFTFGSALLHSFKKYLLPSWILAIFWVLPLWDLYGGFDFHLMETMSEFMECKQNIGYLYYVGPLFLLASFFPLFHRRIFAKLSPPFAFLLTFLFYITGYFLWFKSQYYGLSDMPIFFCFFYLGYYFHTAEKRIVSFLLDKKFFLLPPLLFLFTAASIFLYHSRIPLFAPVLFFSLLGIILCVTLMTTNPVKFIVIRFLAQDWFFLFLLFEPLYRFLYNRFGWLLSFAISFFISCLLVYTYKKLYIFRILRNFYWKTYKLLKNMFLPPEKTFFTKEMLYNLVLALLMTFFLILPDLILKLAGASHVILNSNDFLWGFIPFCIIFSLIGKFTYFLILLFIIFTGEMIQMLNMAYFGRPLVPAAFEKMFIASDIIHVEFFKIVWYVFPLLIICYGILIAGFLLLRKRKTCTRIAPFLVLFLIFFPPKDLRLNPITQGINYVSLSYHSLMNTHSAFAIFWLQYLYSLNGSSSIEFQPYRVEKISDFADVIILFWGESTTYTHMSLYGYERKTTPLLDSYRKNSDFIFKHGIAGGVGTQESTQFFFNSIREPANLNELKKGTGSLFTLAKKNGFRTYWLSRQHNIMMMDFASKDVDYYAASGLQNLPFDYSLNSEEELISLLQDILKKNRGEKMFIVINPSALHGPYELAFSHRPHEFEKFPFNFAKQTKKEFWINTYDCGMLYLDTVLYSFLETIKHETSTSQRVYAFITSDHGQVFDENGIYGHGHLSAELAKVPVILYTPHKKNTNFTDKVKQLSYIPHYTLSKLVAETLGWKLINPNEDGTYFMHERKIHYPRAILPYNISSRGEKTVLPITSAESYFSNNPPPKKNHP